MLRPKNKIHFGEYSLNFSRCRCIKEKWECEREGHVCDIGVLCNWCLCVCPLRTNKYLCDLVVKRDFVSFHFLQLFPSPPLCRLLLALAKSIAIMLKSISMTPFLRLYPNRDSLLYLWNLIYTIALRAMYRAGIMFSRLNEHRESKKARGREKMHKKLASKSRIVCSDFGTAFTEKLNSVYSLRFVSASYKQ